MTTKQKAFVANYLSNGFNATKAAEKAGYAEPSRHGWEVKNHPEVAAAIEQAFAEQAATAGEVLATLAGMMRCSPRDAFEMQGKYPVFNSSKAFETGAIDYVKKISRSPDGSFSIEMYDRHAAAVTIGRHLKMFTDKTEVSGAIEFVEQAAESVDKKLFSGMAGVGSTEVGSDS